MESAKSRFLRYVTYYTTSDEFTGTSPSTERQKDLGRALMQELEALKLEREAGEAIAEQLRAMGHEVEIVDDRTAMGRGEIIWKCENGVYAAGTEPRCDGTVASW